MKKIILLLTLIPVILISSCATSLTVIKEKPNKYVGANVVINARVALKVPVPFMDYSLYQVKDKTDRMFLFTTKEYDVDDKVSCKAHVIGISDGNSLSAIDEIAQQTAAFLEKNKLADSATARALGQKLVRVLSTLGHIAEGSYFLIAK